MEEIVLPFFIGYRKHFKAHCGDWLIHVAGITLGSIGAVVFYVMYANSKSLILLLYTTAIVTFIAIDLFFIVLITLYWQLYLKKRTKTEIILGSSGIYFENSGRTSRIPWDAVEECHEDANSMVIFFKDYPFVALSKDVLMERNAYLSLKKLFKAKRISIIRT